MEPARKQAPAPQAAEEDACMRWARARSQKALDPFKKTAGACREGRGCTAE